MKNSILKYTNKIVYLLLTLLSLFPLLPKAAESILMILAALMSILFFLIEGNFERNTPKIKSFIVLSTLFFIAAATLFYTENINYGFTMIVRLLPIIVFPIVFLLNDKSLLSPKRIDLLKLTYIGALFISLIIVHFTFLNYPNIEALEYLEKRKLFERITKVHGTYFSIWIGFGVILLTFMFVEFLRKKNRLLFFMPLIIIYFLYWQFTIGARMPFFATISFLIFYSFYTTKSWVVLSIFIIGLVSMLVLEKDGISERINNLFNYDFSFPKGKYEVYYKNISEEKIRNGIYYCSYLKVKEAPLLGYGVGDVDDQLQECYDEKFTDTDTYKRLSYNSHNEYINIILISGFAGFSVFLLSFFYLLQAGIKNKLYLSFLCFILLNFCFENILSRHDGIIFFSFFNSLLYFQTNYDS